MDTNEGYVFTISKGIMNDYVSNYVCSGCGGTLQAVSQAGGWFVACEKCWTDTPGFTQRLKAGVSSHEK